MYHFNTLQTSNKTVALQIGADGKIEWDAVLKQGSDKLAICK